MSEIVSLDGVAGSGLESRRLEALRVIDTIADPCSVALGRPIGLGGMGMIAGLSEDDGRVAVEVLPTFPTCMFRGVLEERIQESVGAIEWVRSVSVRFSTAEAIWTESRLSAEARTKLGRAPRRAA
jgi:metal-sulfur cluster biosynthetic enzyme